MIVLDHQQAIHEKNRFGFGPIIEVAVIFAGIFVTMIPALEILGVKGKELGLDAGQFFWATGACRAFWTTRRPT